MIMGEALARDRLYVTADILILTVQRGRFRVLLSRRSGPPYAGQWALPGKFLGVEESAEDAARALLKEMRMPEDAFLEQLYTFTEAGRDPRGRVISTAYLAILPDARVEEALSRSDAVMTAFDIALDGEGLLLAGADARLRSTDLAFDHGRIIETGVRRLRGKIDYTDIGFRFLNDLDAFSLGELLEVFQAVLDRSIDTSNFRRTILSRYEETGRIAHTDRAGRRGRGRPAALYCFIDHQEEE